MLSFKGAMVLVTHDRYMLDRVSTVVLGLNGSGQAQRFADYSQWEVWQAEGRQSRSKAAAFQAANGQASVAKKKLPYLEQREYEGIEHRIAEAELALEARQHELHDPAIVSDGRKLQHAAVAVEEAHGVVNELYARWAQLEKKLNS